MRSDSLCSPLVAALHAFAPSIIFISAGFDAADGDENNYGMCVRRVNTVQLCVFTPCAGRTSPPATSPGLQVYTPATSPPLPQHPTTHCSTNACASDSIRQVARAHSAPIVAVLEGGCVLRVSSEANATLTSACACLHWLLHVLACIHVFMCVLQLQRRRRPCQPPRPVRARLCARHVLQGLRVVLDGAKGASQVVAAAAVLVSHPACSRSCWRSFWRRERRT